MTTQYVRPYRLLSLFIVTIAILIYFLATTLILFDVATSAAGFLYIMVILLFLVAIGFLSWWEKEENSTKTS